MTIMCQGCEECAAETTVQVTLRHVVALCLKCRKRLDSSPDASALIKDLMALVESLSEQTRGGPFEDGENSIVDRGRAFVDREFCECCKPARKCPDHGAALTSNDD